MFPWNVGSLFTCKSTRRYNLEDIFTAVKAWNNSYLYYITDSYCL
jgi:hypothetical protein